MAGKGGVSYEFGHFCLQTEERQLLRDGRPVQLTPKAFETLVLLVERRGKLVRKDELMQALWPNVFVEESNLTNNIWTLRTALGDSPTNRYIETVPKAGYRFVAEVNSVEEQGQTDLAINNDIRRVNETGRHKSQALLLGALIVAIAAGIILWYRNGANIKPEIKSIAVLPFVNTSKNPDTEYLSDGVTESLINNLSQLPNLKVIGSNSSFKYKGKEIDLDNISKALRVEAVLIGRIAQRGDDLLINVELIDTRDKSQIWGEQYSHKSADLLQVQSEISSEIVQKLRLHLTPRQAQQLVNKRTVKPEAYELFIKGRFHWLKSGTENRRKAIDYYQRAIMLDPSYAAAHAEVSFSYSILSNIGEVNPKEVIAEAEAVAQKAVELDENLPEAHLALGVTKLDKWDWTASEREFKRTIELNPNLVRGHSFYSLYLSLIRRHKEALTEAKIARDLDPLSLRANFVVAYALVLARQNDEAMEAAKKMLELDPNYPDAHNILGYAYTAKGQFRDAITAHEQAIKLGNDSPDSKVYLAVAYAKAGDGDKARTILKQLESNPNASRTTLAALYVALQDNERALASLEQAYAVHDSQLQFLAIDPNLDPLRSDPRFQQLVRRVGLPTVNSTGSVP